MTDLSIIIPARNEEFLSRTIQDILENLRGDTEVIAVLDGAWATPGIPQHERVQVVHLGESIGQRAATNLGVRLSSAKYVMKCDAHVSFDEGFDVKLMGVMQPDWTLIPAQKNLHAFDLICGDCGHRSYQGGQCEECHSRNVTKEMVWKPRRGVTTTAWRFDRALHFQYWTAFQKTLKGELTETMSCLGACWMMERERYWALGGLDEAHGSWGQMGTELGCKTWLSGGKMMVHHGTWFAHMFRTRAEEGFGFPYPLSGRDVERARQYSQDLWLNDKWPGQVRPFRWLIEHFEPPDWDEYLGQHEKGVVYYTCNTHDVNIDEACRQQLQKARGGAELVSVSLNVGLEFGDTRLEMAGEKGPLMMHRQILKGLLASTARFVFLCESDVYYHPSHFDFTPFREDVFYYNVNVWKVWPDGLTAWTDDLQQVSGCVASRELLIDYFSKRIAQIERDGFNGHYEPGVKQTVYPRMRGGVYGVQNYHSEYPNLCIRHNDNLTRSKRSPEEFRNAKYAKGWRTATALGGWGNTAELIGKILRGET